MVGDGTLSLGHRGMGPVLAVDVHLPHHKVDQWAWGWPSQVS